MTNFDEIKRKVMETTGTITDKSLVLAKRASEKAVYVAKMTKLSTEVAAERENLRKNYQEIGKLYCQLHKDDPEPELLQAVTEAKVSINKIASKKEEMEELKAQEYNTAAYTSAAEEDADNTEDTCNCNCSCDEEVVEEEKAECDCGCCAEEAEQVDDKAESDSTQE